MDGVVVPLTFTKELNELVLREALKFMLWGLRRRMRGRMKAAENTDARGAAHSCTQTSRTPAPLVLLSCIGVDEQLKALTRTFVCVWMRVMSVAILYAVESC